MLADLLHRRANDSNRSAEAYLSDLAMPGRRREELQILAQDLTVTETSFFRDPAQIAAFSEIVLARRRDRPDQRRLRILSAGCSSGEEAYTLAATVRGVLGATEFDVSITGLDINLAMLRKAAAARYSPWSLRQTSAVLQKQLFRAGGGEFLLDASIRDMVSFQERNLAHEDAEFWAPSSFDVVFCRNVIMYFTPQTAQAVIARIARSLTPGGFLFLGHAETLRGLSSDFHLRHTHGTFYYQRREAGEAPHRTATPDHPSPRSSPPPAVLSGDTWIDTIGRASDRIRLLAASPAPESAAPPPGLAARPRQFGPDLSRAADLIRQERFSEARGVLNSLPADCARQPEVLLLTAILLTHGGDLAAAEAICGKLLAQDEMSAGAHYLLALCRESAQDDRAAADHDQVAAYLDPSFAMPRLHLGILARRAGDRRSASRDLRQALVLLQQEDPSRLLLFSGGFTGEALITLCQAELAACGGEA